MLSAKKYQAMTIYTVKYLTTTVVQLQLSTQLASTLTANKYHHS